MNIFEFALNMEREGEQYYRQLADSAADPTIKSLFNSLADDEKLHYLILKQLEAENYDIAGEVADNLPKPVFKNAEEFVLTGISPAEVEAYLHAHQLEHKSIKLYQDLCGKTGEKEACVLYRLVSEEKRHYEQLDELVIMLNKPKDWVESAEFGVRKEEY